MPRFSIFALTTIVFLLLSCSPSGKPVDERLKKSYSGYYKTCEKIHFDFGKQECECIISSTDFVGHFNDEISGTYTVDSNRVNIQWKDIAIGNYVYTELPLNIADSIILTPSGDSLLLYLEDNAPLTIEVKSQTIMDKAGVVVFYGMVILVLLILCSPLIAIITVVYLIVARKKKWSGTD